MEFQSPELLWLFLSIPALIGAYIWAQRRRARFALRYSSLSLVKDALGKNPGWRRHLPPLFFLVGIATTFIAAARPVGIVALPKQQTLVILAIDTSLSMRANDLKPNRLEAAKDAARTFVEHQDPNTRIGIVAFSGTAALSQVPTTDKQTVLAAINRLTLQRSTAIGSAILTSLDAIFEKPESKPAAPDDLFAAPTPTPTPVPNGTHIPATIILLTDGQNRTGPLPVDAARIAANRGVRVFTIGVGTAQGTAIQPPPNQQDPFGGSGARGGGFGGGGGGFLAVLDEETLKRVAALTDALYFHATDAEGLLSIYKNLDKELVLTKEQEESTVFFTATAAIFLIISGSLSMLWFSRLP